MIMEGMEGGEKWNRLWLIASEAQGRGARDGIRLAPDLPAIRGM
jgi:hypothetical protein